jgi:coenzyme F420 hydrogenase subunit beta
MLSQEKTSFNTLKQNVIDCELCVRCGMCAGVCPIRVIEFNNDRYPVLSGECSQCGLCVKCCPGGDVNFQDMSRNVFDRDYDPDDLNGHVEDLFVCHANDETVRLNGASGGLITALLLYMLEKKIIDGAVVVSMDSDNPCQTKGILATTPAEIIASSQSKYCLTPSMEILSHIRRQKGTFAVVCLPCQVHGLRKLQEADPALAGKIGYIFGLYCACNIEPHGHIEAMRACNIDPDDVVRFQFRGGVWPGGYHVEQKDGRKGRIHPIRNSSVLHIMFRLYGSKRCHSCIDGLAEYADLSFGDFWAFDYEGSFSKLERCTLVSQRTRRGLEILDQAVEDKVITSYLLDKDRQSKRNLSMVRKKKERAFIRIKRNVKKDKRVPDYHFNFSEIGMRNMISDLLYRVFYLFRGPRSRMLVLKLLFSRFGLFYDKLNVFRRRLFSGYHKN